VNQHLPWESLPSICCGAIFLWLESSERLPDKWGAAALFKMISDGKGTASVTIADVYQSNGVIHVIDKVLLPN
jgi:hypothetical protein